jgi:broad specificity phosphatase PhoE
VTRTLLLARHAATGNAERHVISGTLDEPLSDLGRDQARAYVAEHGPLAADAVISSPLSRATETASLLTSRPAAELEIWPTLIDRSYGLLQGLPPEEVATYRSRITYIRAGGIDHSVDPPAGETLDSVRRRAEGLASDLGARAEGRILVVSHQMVLQQLTGVLLGLSLVEALEIDIRVLEIAELEWDGRRASERRILFPGAPALASW